VDGEPQPVGDLPVLPLSPATELYGPVLFQGARFQRLLGYRRLAARGCVADISTTPTDRWFAGFQAQDLVLADPGTRDAVMHAIQCCVPDATLLPQGVDRLILADAAASAGLSQVTLHATERSRDGDSYVYDLDVRDPAGLLVERWEGLRLRAVRKLDGSGPWLPGLLGPYLERRTDEVLPAALRCAVRPDSDTDDTGGGGVATRRGRTAEAVGWALGGPVDVRYRPDGGPEPVDGVPISSSHAAGVTFAVAGPGTGGVGCDVEPAVARSTQDWSDLLGETAFSLATMLATERCEDLSVAATRVWGALECLRKIGRAGSAPLTAEEPRADRWVVLRSGSAAVATFHTRLLGIDDPVVFTLLTEGGD
jgi:enediyne polyketide synthase